MACCTVLWLMIIASFIACSESVLLNTSDSVADVAVVQSNGHLFVVAGKHLYSIFPNLTVEQTFLLTLRNTSAAKVILNSDETTLVVCFKDGTCFTYLTQLLVDLDFQHETGVQAAIAGESFAMGITADGLFHIGSAGYHHPSGIKTILLQQYDSVWGEEYLVRSSNGLAITNISFTAREFIDTFSYGPYIYFITIDNSTISSVSGVKVMRVCSSANNTEFSGIYEATLQCSEIVQGNVISSVTSLIDEFGGMMEPSITLGIGSDSGSALCTFSLSVIDNAMDALFEECASGIHKISVPWVDYRLIADCSGFFVPEVDECHFGSSNTVTSIQALAVSEPVYGKLALKVDAVITAALPMVVDGISLVYVAYTNNSIHTLGRGGSENICLTQFHIVENTQARLIDEQQQQSSIVMLKYRINQLYAITDQMVYTLPLENCSVHTDCSACVRGSDPLCGWCVLEGKCSRKSLCQYAELQSRWIVQSSYCDADFTIVQHHLSATLPIQVDFSPFQSAQRLPALKSNEQYLCVFTNKERNYTFQVLYTSDGVCQTKGHNFPNFFGSKIGTKLSLISPYNHTLFEAEDIVTVYNCSKAQTCKDCEMFPVCGWCVYSLTCTTYGHECLKPREWIGPQNTSRCPALLYPTHGRYKQPSREAANFTLHTRNLPSPISGFAYACKLLYHSGVVVVIDAVYVSTSNDKQISCLVEENQIVLSKSFELVGFERVKLSLLLLNSSGHLQHEFVPSNGNKYYYAHSPSLTCYVAQCQDFIQHDSSATEGKMPIPPQYDMIVYNCSQLANSCSACLSQSRLECGWCTGDDNVPGHCSTDNTCTLNHFIESGASNLCDSPVISSISPSSGHLRGGTMVTINGTDLGVTVDDVEKVEFGNSKCEMLRDLYIPGNQIVCNTTESNVATAVEVTVWIIRNGISEPTSYFSFNYAEHVILSVFPLYGPVSGGTRISIVGSQLNISDTALTNARLAGVECKIINISASKIICLSSPAQNPVYNGEVSVTIDGHTAKNEEGYSYTADPEVSSVHPQFTILAGGVTLRFAGQHLNVTQYPMLIIYIGNETYARQCTAPNSAVLLCPAPPLFDQTLNGTVTLNYTIKMDAAPGPVSPYKQGLNLTLRPNPVFESIKESDREYSGSKDSLTIMGRYVDTIDSSEIEIRMENKICEITSITQLHNRVVLQCNPPTIISTQFNVKVSIANGTLEYDVGTLIYIPPNDIEFSHYAPLIYVSLGTMALFMAIAVCATVVVCLLCIVKRSNTSEMDNSLQSTELHYSDNIIPDYLDTENLYDSIPENTLHNSVRGTNTHPTRIIVPQNGDYFDHIQPLKKRKGSLPPLPTVADEYVEMKSHSLSRPVTSPRRHSANLNDRVFRPSKFQQHGMTYAAEYVDMVPGLNAEDRNMETECTFSNYAPEHGYRSDSVEGNIDITDCVASIDTPRETMA